MLGPNRFLSPFRSHPLIPSRHSPIVTSVWLPPPNSFSSHFQSKRYLLSSPIDSNLESTLFTLNPYSNQHSFSSSTTPPSLIFLSDGKSTSTKEAFDIAVSYLKGKNIPEPESSARYLLSFVGGVGYRYSDFEKFLSDGNILSDEQCLQFENLIKRREQREPVQYLIGNWDFYGLTLQCKPPILIPRPETEELVEMVINSVRSSSSSTVTSTYPASSSKSRTQTRTQPITRFLDIGCGTGAIGIAILSQLQNAECVAIDINPSAVNLAKKNAATHSLMDPNEMNFDDLPSSSYKFSSSTSRYRCLPLSFSDFVCMASQLDPPMIHAFDVIVSNPPYIPSSEMESLDPEVRNNEDHGALDGGIDGLKIIREIISKAPLLLSPNGRREVWLEVSNSHIPSIIEDLVRECAKGTGKDQKEIEKDDSSQYQADYPMRGLQDTNEENVHTNVIMGVKVSVIKDLSGKYRFVHLIF